MQKKHILQILGANFVITLNLQLKIQIRISYGPFAREGCGTKRFFNPFHSGAFEKLVLNAIKVNVGKSFDSNFFSNAPFESSKKRVLGGHF